MDTFQIRSYGIGELARCYAPNITAGGCPPQTDVLDFPAACTGRRASCVRFQPEGAQLYARSGPPDRRGAGGTLKLKEINNNN